MNIFLRRIPANTKHAEISEFIASALKNGFFRKSARILNVEILALQDTRVGTIEYHGLVTLDSDKAVENVVKLLNSRRLNGRMVMVRRYFHRSWYNDPRQQQTQIEANIQEKRKGDRRRGKHLQVIKNVSDRYNSQDDFFNSIHHQQFMVNFVLPIEIEDSVLNAIYAYEKSDPELELNHKEELISDVVAFKFQPIRFCTDQSDDPKTSNVQIYAEKRDITELLENLKVEFAKSGIQYWVLPVIEKGQL